MSLLAQKGFETTMTYSFEWEYENFCVAVEDVMDEEQYAKLDEDDLLRM